MHLDIEECRDKFVLVKKKYIEKFMAVGCFFFFQHPCVPLTHIKVIILMQGFRINLF